MIQGLFTVDIAVVDLLSPKECEMILEVCRELPKKPHGLLYGDNIASQSSHGELSAIDYIDQQLDFILLRERIQQEVNNLSNHLGVKRVTVTSSWVNYQYPGSILREHIHQNSSISGALFLKCDDKSSKLYFENPNPFKEMLTLSGPMQTMKPVTPSVGRIVIFPSWLRHGSNGTQNGSDERVILSFNSTQRSHLNI